jgi:hypothetical protein
MLNVNVTTFSAVVDQAMRDACAHPRRLAAINRAVVEVLSNPYMERDPDHGGILIGSTSGRVYAANGVCQCEAYAHGFPCYHRAAARLVRLHDQQLAKAEIDADISARQAEAQRQLDECFA